MEFIVRDPFLNQEVLYREDKKVKSKQRLGDKLEFIDWDLLLNQEILYREDKKVKSIRDHPPW